MDGKATKLVKYLDIPLQHIDGDILKRMNRKTTKANIEEFVKNVKNLPEFISVRTTLMTGFPGETEEDFNELCEFLQTSRLLNVGFFAYSKEEGTPAANLPNQVDENIKQQRLLKLMKLQEKIAKEENKKFIGKIVEVCCEGVDYDKQMFYGRSQYQAPDVDSIVFFKSNEPICQGEYYKVKIKGVTGYDLKGEVIYE
jgi:ribosomal protein S12 methylthiotransferase